MSSSIKLALAVTVPGVDVGALIQRQRTATINRLQDLTRLKAEEHGENALAWSLVLENLRYVAEAEVRWLDHCEAMVARAARERALLEQGAGPRKSGRAAGRDKQPATRATGGDNNQGER